MDAHILAAKVEPPPEDMRVAGEGFLITSDENVVFWEYVRAMGDAAGYLTRREDVCKVCQRSLG